MKVGDIVEYTDDWKKGRQWYLYSINSKGLCQIVLLRNGSYTTVKHFKSAGFEWYETYLNANITNLPIEKIKLINNN